MSSDTLGFTDRVALRLGRFVTRRPWVVIAATLLLAIGASSGTRFLAFSNNYRVFFRFLTQMCARFSPSRSAAPWEEGADALVPANQRCSRLSLSRRPPARAPLLVEGLLGGSRSHRKVLRCWHLQGDEP